MDNNNKESTLERGVAPADMTGSNFVVTTLAGNYVRGFKDGKGKKVCFNVPLDIQFHEGRLLVADHNNSAIRSVGLDGTVTTYFTIIRPTGLCVGPDGKVYVTTSFRFQTIIQEFNPVTGLKTEIAGGESSYRDGKGKDAQFGDPEGVIFKDGKLLITDRSKHSIRELDLQEDLVTTYAGHQTSSWADRFGYLDGSRTGDGRLWYPKRLAISLDGTIYYTDNHLIRAIYPNGEVKTIAGKIEMLGGAGFADGIGCEAKFNNPTGIAIGPDGLLYVADTNNNRIRVVNPTTGQVQTIAGGEEGFADGVGDIAKFDKPNGITIGPDGIIYVTDTDNNSIRVISPK
jgi:sugar lactone lactonase YvrE